MTRGKNSFRMTEYGTRLPRNTVVDPVVSNAICRFDAGIDRHTESEFPSANPECDALHSESDIDKEQIQDHEKAPAKKAPRIPANLRIPSLRNTKIKLRGKISGFISPKPHKSSVPEPDRFPPDEYIPVDEIEEEVASILSEPSVHLAEGKHSITSEENEHIVPTPAKRPRISKVDAGPMPAKPLKVIRRRREEAPKIFETVSMNFPKSMLEGIEPEREKERDLIPE